MKIRRYFTKSAFQAAINDGTIQAFDYLHPKSEDGLATSIDAVYIGTHASHWVCYALINKYSPRWAYTSKYLTKMVSAFSEGHRSGHEGRPIKAEFLSRMIEFTSLLDRLDTVRAETDKAAEVKVRDTFCDARLTFDDTASKIIDKNYAK